jgi:tetratricopeptide (TPR) repeat protein
MGDLINSILQNICNSETFRLAHQQREFLVFLVNRLKNNEPGSFKESLIGIDFFDRKPGYDPKADPIVRVEAHRLRRRLQSYYRKEGAQETSRIELSKGSYIPVLTASDAKFYPTGWLLAVFVRTNDELTNIGLTAELVKNLGKLKNLRVLAVQSMLTTEGDLQKAVSDLGANSVLECCINGPEIRAELKHIIDGKFELIGSFDNQIQSAVETVSMFVASTLQSEVGKGTHKTLADPVDRETYQIYLSGRGWFHHWSPDNLTRAVEHFKEVLRRYPNYAPAFAGLADCQVLFSYWYAANTRESLEQGFAWASRALELDPECGEAYCSLAAFQIALNHEWKLAEGNFRRAIQQNPSNSLGLNWLSIICLVPLRRFEEAVDTVFEAYDLDPVSPEVGNEIVWVRINCRQFAESAEQGRRMVSQHKEFLEAYWALGLAESALGSHEAALQAFQVAEDLSPNVPHTLAWRGFVEGRAGNENKARDYLSRLDAIRTTAPVRSIHYAWVLTGLQETDAALDYFGRAMAEADPFTLYADTFFVYDTLRKYPRFQNFRKQLNLL